MLNVGPLQKELAQALLQRIPEFADADADAGAGGGGGASVPQLILGQFRWLDALADPHALTSALLEVLPAMPADAQRHAVAFLPEVASEEDHAEVLDALEGLVQEDAAFLVPAMEALSSLALGGDARARVVALVQSRLQSADVGDLPAAARFLLREAAAGGPGPARAAVAALRAALHFVAPSDPRLAVPDRKQKGRVAAAGEDPEARVLEALRQAVQQSPAVAAAVLKEVRAAADPAAHRTFDLWALLALAALGGDRRKAALAALRKKLADGEAGAAWLEAGVAGHRSALGPHFAALLAAAHHLLSAPAPPAAAGGAALYAALFRAFDDTYSRTEVLRHLHAHLGATAGQGQGQGEADAALGVLRTLAADDTAALLQYACFLSNVLDYVCGFTDAQLAGIFEMFADLVAGACAGAAGGAGGAAAGGRSRMEDELFIFLRKQLSGAHAVHRKVGVVGTVALVQRLAGELPAEALAGGGALSQPAAAAEGSALVQRYREARALLSHTFDGCRRCPESFMLLCDELARGAARGSLPPALVADLGDRLRRELEEGFVADAAPWLAAAPDRALWWDLNGGGTDGIVLGLAPPRGEVAGVQAGGPGAVAPLLALLRAVAALEMGARGNLDAVDALLGCAMGLFDPALASPQRFHALPPPARRAVLLSLFYATNWCREAVNAFAPLLPHGAAAAAAAAAGLHLDLKVMSRLRAACQLEAALGALLPLAPPLFALPRLGDAAAAGDRPGAVKPAAKAAARGKAKKKTVRIAEAQGDDEEEGGSRGAAAGGASAGTAAAASEQERATATRSGGSGSTQGGGGAGGGAAGAGASASAAALASERSKFRDLQPGALAALGVAADSPDPCYSMLPPAAYLLADLAAKLRASLAPAKRATALRPAAAPPAGAVPAADLLRALRPLLPALRAHLDTAADVVAEQLLDGAMAGKEAATVWAAAFAAPTQGAAAAGAPAAATYLCAIDGCAAAAAAASPAAAAPRVTALALECLRLLLAFPDLALPEHRPFAQALLAAFASEGAASPAAPAAGAARWDRAALVDGCRRVCVYLLTDMVPEHEREGDAAAELSGADMERWHGALLAVEALLAAADRLFRQEAAPAAAEAKLMRRMREKLAASAAAMLRQRWPGAGAAVKGGGGGGGGAAGGWAGRARALDDALRLSIGCRADPVAAVQSYVDDALPLVTPTPRGAANAAPVDGWPSLSGATLGAWYKACWAALLAHWARVVAAAAAAAKDKDAALLADPEGAGAVAGAARACAAAFHSLVAVVRGQDRRPLLHVEALRSAEKLLAAVPRLLPFWTLAWGAHQEDVLAAVSAGPAVAPGIVPACCRGGLPRLRGVRGAGAPGAGARRRGRAARMRVARPAAFPVPAAFPRVPDDPRPAPPRPAPPRPAPPRPAPARRLQAKDLQRGSRVLQTLSAEVKVGKAGGCAHVPALRKALEKFLCDLAILLAGVGEGAPLRWGDLKHKDLAGREVPSQYQPDPGSDDESVGGDEGEEEGEEGEEIAESQHPLDGGEEDDDEDGEEDEEEEEDE
jgi:hypothetical protein